MVVEEKLKNRLNKIIESILSINDIDSLYDYSKKYTAIDIIVDGCDITSNKIAFLKNFLCEILIKKEKELLSKQKEDSFSLNNILSKNLMNGEKLLAFLQKSNCKNRNIGTIPNVFLDKVKDKKNTAIAIYDLFAQYSLRLNYDYELDYDDCDYEVNHLPPDIESFIEHLSALINKPVQMSYVGSGFNGNGFKIVIDKQKFFYKVFYLYNSTDPKRYYNHGGLAEPQMALFATKNSPKSKFVKFFFGRVCNVMGIDSFLVTEFVERDDKLKNDNIKLVLDYVKISKTEEHKFDNKINGKIVDFGGIRIAIPELKDKRLRNIVRIILASIYYEYDEILLFYQWKIPNKTIEDLQKYLKKHCYEKTLKQALNLIERNQTYIIPELVSKLGNFQNLSNEKDFVYSKYICLNDILKNNLYDIHDTIKEFNLEVKTQSEPIPELNAFGYLILRLNSCIQVVYFYDVNNKINKIRIERITNNLIETIIEFDNDKNLTYDNVELHKILTKNSLLP